MPQPATPITATCETGEYRRNIYPRADLVVLCIVPTWYIGNPRPSTRQDHDCNNVSLLRFNHDPSKMLMDNPRATPTPLPRPAVAQILSNPAYPDTVWDLTPTQSGKVPVAEGRGGPFNIQYEVHGTGDIKLVVCNCHHLNTPLPYGLYW